MSTPVPDSHILTCGICLRVEAWKDGKCYVAEQVVAPQLTKGKTLAEVGSALQSIVYEALRIAVANQVAGEASPAIRFPDTGFDDRD